MLLGKDLTDGLDDNTLNAKKKHYVNVTEQQKKLRLSLPCNGVDSYIFVKGVEIYKFKAKHSETIALCLGHVSKDFSVDNMKNTG